MSTDVGVENPTRRDFLKIASSALGATIALEGGVWAFLNYTATLRPPPERTFPPDFIYTGPEIKYLGEEASTINTIQQDFLITIKSPSQLPSGEATLPWKNAHLITLSMALQRLPPSYLHHPRSPKEFMLIRTNQDNPYGIVELGYASRSLVVTLARNFSPHAPEPDIHNIYGDQASLLTASLAHEYTHAYDEGHLRALTDWIEQMGWTQAADNTWKNAYSQNLPPAPNPIINPVEDKAICAGLMAVRPDILSFKRKRFFLSRPEYRDWGAVKSNRL